MEMPKFPTEPKRYDYSKLNWAIKKHFGKQCVFAAYMGLSERAVSLKLNNIRGWKQQEMHRFCDLLQLPYTEIANYFFVEDVQN